MRFRLQADLKRTFAFVVIQRLFGRKMRVRPLAEGAKLEQQQVSKTCSIDRADFIENHIAKLAGPVGDKALVNFINSRKEQRKKNRPQDSFPGHKA